MDGRGAILLVGLFLLIGSIDGSLTGKQVKQILRYHRNVRSNVSPPAGNMKRLKWDEELATLAQQWADSCPNGHNPRRTHSEFDYVGENMASSSKPDVLEMVGLWKNEEKIYNYKSNACKPDPGNHLLKSCGHYTQMVWADTTRVGCGFKEGCNGINHLVCNYGTGGNMNGRRPYEA